MFIISSHAMLFALLYTSSALAALNDFKGINMRTAVRQHKLALYISAKSPVNDTARRSVCTLLAPRAINSFAKMFSNPLKVFAKSGNSLYSITNFLFVLLNYCCRQERLCLSKCYHR